MAALPAWRAISPGDRARLLRRFAEVVDGANEELAQLEVANSGHTISNARWEAGNVRDVLAYYAGAPERLFGRQIPVAGRRRRHLPRADRRRRDHRAVELPHADRSWGFVPALAAGNTVVLKPADLTPLTAIRIGELALEAGIPEDVFQVLPGAGIGRRLALRHAPGRRQGLLHRLDRGRPKDHGRLRRAGEARDARARRQERQHRLRRR